MWLECVRREKNTAANTLNQYTQNRFGVEVVRYTNAEVLNNLEGVYHDLRKRIAVRKQPPKSPLSGGLGDGHIFLFRLVFCVNLRYT